MTNQRTLVNANQLAQMLSVSVRHVWRMKASGKLPKEINIGKSVRWRVEEIDRWLSMGCPGQKQFVTLSKSAKGVK